MHAAARGRAMHAAARGRAMHAAARGRAMHAAARGRAMHAAARGRAMHTAARGIAMCEEMHTATRGKATHGDMAHAVTKAGDIVCAAGEEHSMWHMWVQGRSKVGGSQCCPVLATCDVLCPSWPSLSIRTDDILRENMWVVLWTKIQR